MIPTTELLKLLRSWSSDLPVSSRISVLGALVEYWHGERPAYDQPVTANIPLPPALAWLYAEIAARNSDAFSGSPWISGYPMIIFNSPRNPGEFEVDETGTFAFLIEQQGVYRCGAQFGDEDGPVFRQDETEWSRCAA